MLPAISTAVAALLALGSPAEGGPASLVEMELAGVFPLEDAHSGVLVLRLKGPGETLLPIVVGKAEADAVSRRMRRETPRRPRTQEVLEHAIAALGGEVVRVEIHDASDALYEARVLLAQGARRFVLDARPSDAIALALPARAPIFATRKLVAAAGLAREDLDRVLRSPSAPAPDAAPDERM